MVLLLLLACVPPAATVAGRDSAGEDHDDGDRDDDADGDGFPAWDRAADPARADCDDDDPAVHPGVERLVPAGPFWQGDDAIPDASPAHEVTLSAYCMDVYEVTNARMVVYLDALRAAGTPDTAPSGHLVYDFWDDDDDVPERILDLGDAYAVQAGYEDHPVTEMWAEGAMAYCAARGQRLPTEAEWEKAARGDGDHRHHPWGDEPPDCGRANHRPGEETDLVEPCLDDTTPVGSYPDGVSPYGLFDLAGNVAEVTADWYRADYYAEAPAEDPPGPPDGEAEFGTGWGSARVNRGGGFASSRSTLDVSARIPDPAEGTSNGVGFRCARTPVATVDAPG